MGWVRVRGDQRLCVRKLDGLKGISTSEGASVRWSLCLTESD